MSTTPEIQQTQPHPHVTHYTVDSVPQETTEATLTVREILEHAGLDPANHYLVELQGSHQIDLKDLNQEVHIHEKEEFISVFTGPTPFS